MKKTIDLDEKCWAESMKHRWRFHLGRGARCLKVGDFSGALRHFGAAHLEAPTEPLVCLAWGRELLRMGQLDRAEELLRFAWTRDQTLESAGLSLARLLGLDRRRPAEAFGLLDEVQRLHGVSSAWALLRAEITLGDPALFAEAERLFEQAGRLGADESTVKLGMARAYNAEGVWRSAQGSNHRALFALKRAADLDPDWAGPLVNSGAVFERLGQRSRAMDQYRAALDLDPKNPVALFNLAESLCRIGRSGEAARLYRRLLEVQPNYPGARDGLRRARGLDSST